MLLVNWLGSSLTGELGLGSLISFPPTLLGSVTN
jgi:hypothetical protein